MSRPIGCEHGGGTVASDTQPILDYGWWASNVGSDVGTSGIAHNLVAFHQGVPFAVASVLTAAAPRVAGADPSEHAGDSSRTRPLGSTRIDAVKGANVRRLPRLHDRSAAPSDLASWQALTRDGQRLARFFCGFAIADLAERRQCAVT
jgi:hypothetical protein